MKLKETAVKIESGIEETLTFAIFQYKRLTRVSTNNVIERINQKIRWRTRAFSIFPIGNSTLMLVCAACDISLVFNTATRNT
jgi:putative transposase